MGNREWGIGNRGQFFLSISPSPHPPLSPLPTPYSLLPSLITHNTHSNK
ncbi:hypothetical protein PI95_025285 [Hassallia byssoidea VB512170]|uniref:Uncharacterized protein n=1 Tax=Hassallia byssoidea VB512170 TaxID=1304833 RepID=A0A846HFQ7_9CYAN|nr:hypothetical protein [Hassalia byssoidea]NEU75778.1 hypothetical protein [Hassalia byssoidea VB512170]